MPMIYDLAAIVLAGLALCVSTYLALQQAAWQRRSTHLPAYLSLLNEFRSLEFQDRYRYV